MTSVKIYFGNSKYITLYVLKTHRHLNELFKKIQNCKSYTELFSYFDMTKDYEACSTLNKESDIKGELVPTGSNIPYAMTKNGLVKYTQKNKNVVAGYEFEFATLYNLMDKISYNKKHKIDFERTYMI